MLNSCIGLFIFSICTAAVFTVYLKDSLIAQNCYIFAAISGAVYALPTHNFKALFYSFIFILAGSVYYVMKELFFIVKDTWLFHENK